MGFFAESLAAICAHSLVAPGRPLRWVIIANPTAGGFTMHSRWKKTQRDLEKCRAAALKNPLRENCFPADTAGLMLTTGPGCGKRITGAVMEELGAKLNNGEQPIPFYLIIVAGGDGTSLEVLSVLYDAPASLRAHIAVLRLPMGTGNDGADAPTLTGALALLIKPSRIEYTPALRLLTATNAFLAFNILSVGLDAYVTHMTNKMKGKLPGDFYKLWVDIASLLYDRLYTVDFLDVRAWDEYGKEVHSFREKLLLLAVGASGHRTYGAQKKVLPDDRNVCAITQMPLLRKLALKGLFASGGHVNRPEAIMCNARRVEITGTHPILAQMDGEAILLHREHFPIVIELTAPVIPVLFESNICFD